jgi:hemerythrin-like metal-binding protein
MAIQSAMAKQKTFIISSSFRGPDRRAAKISNYKGPFRRSDDTLAPRQSGAIVKSQSAINGIMDCDNSPKTVNLPKNTDIVWSANISTGRADIDDEHKKIIEFLKLLGSASSDEYEKLAVSEVIDGLKEYVKIHFAHEELLMDSFEYDEIENHKKIHAEFIKKLDKLDINSLRKEGGGERLFVLIYNWLVSHIIGIDRVMIAKMKGVYDDGMAIDTVQRQTNVVIGNAYQLAMAIVSSHNNSSSSYMRNMENISKLTVRLVNLMELAEIRVRTSGCSDFQLKRLGEIQTSLIKTAESLTQYAAEQISARCTNILMGGNCIPLGLGEVLGHQIGRLFKLAWVAGGVDSLGSSAKAAINNATKLSDEVLALKGLSRTNIADFM